jgi:hypothetical protein
MSSVCVVPQNEPVYQALLDKAESYSPLDKYKAAAYRKVADEVAILDTNLYSIGSHRIFIPRAGDSTMKFIRDFIASPKPSKSTEDDDVTKGIKEACAYRSFSFTPQLVDEFHSWYAVPGNTNGFFDLAADKSKIPWSISRISKFWTSFICPSIQKHFREIDTKKEIYKYCLKNNIPFSHDLFNQYTLWADSDINNTTETGEQFGFPPGRRYELNPKTCVHKWFATLGH